MSAPAVDPPVVPWVGTVDPCRIHDEDAQFARRLLDDVIPEFAALPWHRQNEIAVKVAEAFLAEIGHDDFVDSQYAEIWEPLLERRTIPKYLAALIPDWARERYAEETAK